MTTPSENVEPYWRASQRKRRSREEAREVDRQYMRRQRMSESFRRAERIKNYLERRNPKTWARQAIRSIKYRAKSLGQDFTITEADLVLPTHCPVLGIELYVGGKLHPNSPSVDRMDNSRGYTPDNVRVISTRANILKKDASAEELRLVYLYAEECERSPQ